GTAGVPWRRGATNMNALAPVGLGKTMPASLNGISPSQSPKNQRWKPPDIGSRGMSVIGSENDGSRKRTLTGTGVPFTVGVHATAPCGASADRPGKNSGAPPPNGGDRAIAPVATSSGAKVRLKWSRLTPWTSTTTGAGVTPLDNEPSIVTPPLAATVAVGVAGRSWNVGKNTCASWAMTSPGIGVCGNGSFAI